MPQDSDNTPMKKKIIICLFILLIILAIAVSWIVSNVSSLVRSQETRIEKSLQAAIGVPVDLVDIDVRILPSPRITLGSLRLGKQSKENTSGVGFDNLQFSLRPLPLLKGKLAISELSLRNPHIRLLQQGGKYVIEGLENLGKKIKKIPTETPSTSHQPKSPPPGLPAFLSLALESLRIDDGQIDIVQKDKTALLLSGIRLRTAVDLLGHIVHLRKTEIQASANGQFPFSISAEDSTVNGETKGIEAKNVEVNTPGVLATLQANIDSAQQRGKIEVASLVIEIEKLIEALRSSALLSKSLTAKMTGNISGQGSITLNGPNAFALDLPMTLKGLSFSQNALSLSDLQGVLNIKGDSGAAKVKSQDLQLKIGSEVVQLQLDGRQEGQKNLSAQLQLAGFGGSAESSFSLIDNGEAFRTSLQANSFDLTRLISSLTNTNSGMAGRVKGSLQKFTGNFSGKIGNTLLQRLAGQGQISLVQLRVEGLNILGQVVGGLSQIPAFGKAITSHLSSAQAALLTQDFTNFQSLESSFRLQNGNAFLDSVDARSETFRFDAKGVLQNLRQADVRSTMFLQAPFASSLLAAVKETKYLLNPASEMVLPVHISGELGSKLHFEPDTEQIVKTALKAGGREKAEEALGKVLGNKELGKGIGSLLGF